MWAKRRTVPFRDAWRRLNGRRVPPSRRKSSGDRNRLIAGRERQPAPGIDVNNLTQLVKSAQRHGLRCIIDSSGEALAAALDVGNIELVKPNQKELSALVGRDLSQPDDVRHAAQELIRSGKVRRVVVSLGPQGALGVDASGSVQVVPPPMKSQSTVGAGDSMVGAMTLRLAEDASLEDMVRFGVAAGSAATINQGTRLCSLENTQKIYTYLCGR
jgi:6-phosphofructokinase 2